MARKKAPPKRAPEYEKPKPKKKSPPGKAKDGSKCFTRTNKGGAAYVTCEGSQKKAKAKASLKRGGSPPVMTKKKAPAKPKPKPKPKSTIGGYSGQKVKVGTLNKGSLNLTKPKPKAEPSQVKSAWTFFEKKFKGIGPSEHLKEHKVELNKDGTYNVYEYPMVFRSGDFEKSRKLVGKINSKDISFRRGTKAMDDTTAIIGEVKSAKAKPSVSKEDFMNVSSIIGTRNKQRVEENFEKLTTWNPLATAKLAPNTWTAVRIFPYSGGGKGKIYEAYYKKNFKNQHRKLKPNRGAMGSNMSMTWGQNAAHYHPWEDTLSSVIIIRDMKTKNIVGGAHTLRSKTRKGIHGGRGFDGADEAPRRQFRFSNGDVNTIEREGGEYKFPIDGSGNDSDLILAPLNIQKYYKYSEEKAIEGEDQEHDHPNDIVRKFKFKPAVKDINKLIFTYRY